MRSVTAQEFNRDVSAAKRAAYKEPVFVTKRGKPTHVLVSIDEWSRRSAASPIQALRAGFGAWAERDYDGASYVEALRTGERLARR
jgi:prevent-host-death family protein